MMKNLSLLSLLVFSPSCLLFISLSEPTNAQSYQAVVVAYKPEDNPDLLPIEKAYKNVKNYVSLLNDLQNQADIVVFPEYGLTTLKAVTQRSAHLEPYSICTPELPATVFDDPILRNISLAAKRNGLYVVINVVEKNSCNDVTDFYSTDLVFDTEGRLVEKCRKKYLVNEKSFSTGNLKQKCSFEAKFKGASDYVKFAVLFDKDVEHELADKTIHNAVLTSSTPNGLPLSFGLSLQQAFAVRNKINLLASGYTDTDKGYGGSGIYKQTGISKVLLGSESFLVDKVPIDYNNPSDVINVTVTPSRSDLVQNILYDDLPLLEEDKPLISHDFPDLSVHCKMAMNGNGNNIFPYKWVAVNYTETKGNDFVFCALIRPKQNTGNNQLVSSASIEMTLKMESIRQLLPLSLKSDSSVAPANFQFEEKTVADTTHVKMSLTQHSNLSVFGVLVYFNPNSAPSGGSSVYPLVCAIVSAVFILRLGGTMN